MTIQDQLRRFILTEFNTKLSESLLTDNYPLLDTETIDSLAVFTIVQFIEDEFGIEVGDDDLVIDNFTSISDMARMVEAKVEQRQGT